MEQFVEVGKCVGGAVSKEKDFEIDPLRGRKTGVLYRSQYTGVYLGAWMKLQ